MSDPVIVSTIRTVRVRTHPATNLGKLQAIDRTQAEWKRAVDFYTAFFLDHQDVFAETKIGRNRKKELVAKPWTAQDLLTWAERGTVRTKAHPVILREFAAVCPQMPTVLRRAAINAASGAVKSYRTIHQTWDQTDPLQRGHEPPLPDPHPFLTLYDGMVNLDTARAFCTSRCWMRAAGRGWRFRLPCLPMRWTSSWSRKPRWNG